MNLSKKGTPITDTTNKTTLNPNAAEFIPFSLRSPSGTGDVTAKFDNIGTVGKPVVDRSHSSVSNNSDDEAHQYWRQQLPDDITPDFKVMGDDESQGVDSLTFAGLSLYGSNENSRFSTSSGTAYLTEQSELSPHQFNVNSFTPKIRYPVSSYGEDQSSPSFLQSPTKPWDKHIVNGDQLLSGRGRDGLSYNGNSQHGFGNDMLSASANTSGLEDSDVNPIEFLASQFPGFAAESLADVYFANGCDLNLTIEMLTQLELQVDGGLNQHVNSKNLSAPSLSTLDFPALPVPDGQNSLPKYAGDNLQQSVNPYRLSDKENILMFKSSSSVPSRGTIDFASAVRKLAAQGDSGTWNDRNGSSESSVGSSRSSHVLASSYNSGLGRGIYGGDRSPNHGSARAAPVWLETGEAVANMYSKLREEACDHARLRNAYFEQARQAYLIGNKALAKELSVKGQLHNMHMKAAHGKAQDSIYSQRNPVGSKMVGNGRGNERMIDLHGLHVSEAIHVLEHELNALRGAARSAGQHLHVYICVGTGHHTKGSRTPARLPIAVQRYLLEEEGLEYTEPQPGLLRVVLY